MSTTNFTKPESKARLIAIETYIGSRAKPTTKDIMFTLGMPSTTVSLYLRQLVATNKIHEVQNTGRSKTWAIGRQIEVKGAVAVKAARAKPSIKVVSGKSDISRVRESLKITRRFVKTWPLCMVRDPLHTAFFGPAPQSTGAHA